MSGVRIERDGRVAVLRLDKARGNAIDEPLVTALAEAAAEAARDDAVAGVLLASAHPKLFCPGLDLVSLADYDRPGMERFMTAFAVSVWALYGLPKPVVVAVSGAAVAGGLILALTGDHRVLRRGAAVGLNEVKVGVPLPWSVTRLLRASAAPQALGRIALLGRNFENDDALAAGLADELAEAEGFEAACRARLDEFVDKDARALAATKAFLREPVLAEMMAHERERLPAFLDGWFSASTQERIRATVASLKARG
jgi:enoyl-CoA hydratase/carnithine racemase